MQITREELVIGSSAPSSGINEFSFPKYGYNEAPKGEVNFVWSGVFFEICFYHLWRIFLYCFLSNPIINGGVWLAFLSFPLNMQYATTVLHYISIIL